MEGSADPYTSSHRYGLEGGQQEVENVDNTGQNSGADGEAAEARKHMSAYERRLQKKKVW